MKTRTIWVIVLMGLSLWWSSLITPPVITSKTAYFPTLDKGHRQSPLTPHDPIQILSDAYWSSQGWPGAGTTENPYRIENLIINPPTWTHAIEINNTRCHVLIQNCQLSASGYSTYTIYLGNAYNVAIHNTTCSRGTRFYECNNTQVTNSSLGVFAYFCRYGNFAFNQGNIHLLNSSHYQIQDNSLTQVRITSSLHNVITGNFINGSSQEGIHIAGPGAYPSGFYPPSVGNNITYNIITHHRIGLEVEPVSYDTHVEWNLFAHNDHHAADRGENTFFEFNYWDDYEGLDLNFDGYGDTPYLVSGGGGYGVANSDPHPLISAPGYPAVHPLEWIGQYLIELAIPLLPLLIIGVIFLSCCLIYALYMRRYRI